MRRLTILFIALCVLVFCAGCGDKTGDSSSSENISGAGSSKTAESDTEEAFYTVNGTHNAYYDNIAASDGNDIYYVKNREIWKLNPDGDDTLTLGKSDTGLPWRSGITGGDGMLFFSFYTDGDDSIHCYQTATGTETSLGFTAGSLFYYEGWLYFRSDEAICRCKSDGSEVTEIIKTDGRFWALYQDWLYVIHNNGDTVRIHIDGSGEEAVDRHTQLPMVVHKETIVYNQHDHEYNTDGDYLYCWVDYGTENMFLKCTDPDNIENGTQLEGVNDAIGESDHVSYLNIAGDYLVFSSGYTDTWYVVRKDGTFVKELGELR